MSISLFQVLKKLGDMLKDKLPKDHFGRARVRVRVRVRVGFRVEY